MSGLQCRKLLWHVYNAKELIPATGAGTQAIFDQGHEVGMLAKRVFPDGVTGVNRLRRAGMPKEVVMRSVNHASELMNKIYQREEVEDLAQRRDAVQFAI